MLGISGCLSGILSGCLSDDGTNYDVPLRSQARSASLEVAADGTPYVLAEVGMNYGTRDKLGEWDPHYKTLNVQSILYSFGGGAWKAFPFRNLRDPLQWSGESMLLLNDKGGIQPLIPNRLEVILYGRSGDTWLPKSKSSDPQTSTQQFYFSASKSMLLRGDSVWQTPYYDYPTTKLAVRTSTGGSIPLDSGWQSNSMGFLRGSRRDFLISSGYPFISSSSSQQPTESPLPELVAYSWRRDPASADVRKQTLLSGGSFYSFVSAQVEGESRFFIKHGLDTMSAFTLRNDSIIPLGDVDPEAFKTQDDDPRVNSYLSVDPQGCFHTLTSLPDSGYNDWFYDSGNRVHYSSCASGVDTLIFPGTGRDKQADPSKQARPSDLKFTAEGRPMILMTRSETDIYGGSEVGPSGIYAATLGPDRKWIWDTIVEF